METIANISVGVMFVSIGFLALVLIAKPIITKIRAKREAKKLVKSEMEKEDESNSHR